MVEATSQEELVYVARIPGLPKKEDVQAYLNELGAEFIGAYDILSGIQQRVGMPAVDGVEVMFKMHRGRMPSTVAVVGGFSGRVYVGRDLTNLYR